jgi:hypothetical protein
MRLVTFFKVQTENARSLKGTCDNLLGKLTKDENDAEGLPDSALQYFDSPDTSADFNNGILKALQSIAECDSASHETTGTMPAGEEGSQTLWHPARLCLHELEGSENLILVSDVGLALWQEFCLRTYVYSAQQSRRQSDNKVDDYDTRQPPLWASRHLRHPAQLGAT